MKFPNSRIKLQLFKKRQNNHGGEEEDVCFQASKQARRVAFYLVLIILTFTCISMSRAESEAPQFLIFNDTAYTLKKGEWIIPLGLGFDYGLSDKTQIGFKIIPLLENIMVGYNDKDTRIFSEFNYNMLYIKRILNKKINADGVTALSLGIHKDVISEIGINGTGGSLKGWNLDQTTSVFVELISSKRITNTFGAHIGIYSDIFLDDAEESINQEIFFGFDKKYRAANLLFETSYRSVEKRLLIGSAVNLAPFSHYRMQLGVGYAYKDIYYFPVLLFKQWWIF